MQAKARFCLCIVFLVLSMLAKAQKEPVYIDALIGDSIMTGKKLVVKDSSFYDTALKPSIKHTYFINNLVSLRINEDAKRVMPDSFVLSVKVKIIYTAPETLSDSIPEKTLTINYNKSKPYDNKSIFYFTSAHYVEVQVLDISASYADTSVILPLAILENRMVIERLYQMDCTNDAVTSVVKDTTSISRFGELKISWTPNHASQMYDVEWTYLDGSAVANGQYSSNGHLDPSRIFRHNATRITTKADTCMIPLFYDGEGYLVFRIRGVQVDQTGELQTTLWNTDIDTTSEHWKYHFQGHERLLNWQASTMFAEEGKRKSVVQYFDGSLRARQVVSRDNTNKTTVVAETMYDKQGRPAIQVMPAPTLSTLVHYTPFFNVASINGAEYDKGVYDTLIAAAEYCDMHEDSMSVGSGASQYYSPLNPLKGEGMHRFIPDARGFAFSQTQYTQDNTGRIYAQGGVGQDFTLGSGRENKYYYFAAEQDELDALFGTEAGDASHYQKNLVRDANGQYSVSYMDMHGRTVATALAGKVPASLSPLSSWRDEVVTEELLSSTNNLIKDNSVEFSTSIFMTKDDSVALHYKLAKNSVSLKDCKDSNVCYSCLYDLSITVTGDCASSVSGMSDTTVNLKNFPLWRVDSTCDLAIPIDTVITLYLKEGGYNISKRLAISKDGMDKYRDSVYLKRNTCTDYDSIYRRQMKIIKDSLTCSVDSLGSPEYLRYRDIMLFDMYPLSGQYGDTSKTRSCFSIFDKADNVRFYYQAVADTGACYENELGDCDFVVNSAGQTVRPEQLTPEEFISSFKSSWLEKLLPLHPEYQILLQYDNLAASFDFDEDFENTRTYSEALAKGYLNPTNSTTSPASKFVAATDPLYGYSFGATAKQAIEDSLFSYRSGSGLTLTVWGLATGLVKCQESSFSCAEKWNNASNVFNTDSLCVGELDMAWRIFQSLYLSQKRAWVEQYIYAAAGVSSGSLCSPVFQTRNDLLASGGYSEFGNESNQTAGADSAASFYQANCEAYVERWKEQLSNGCYSEVQKDSIIADLLAVCKEGADDTHPFGASSVKPSSTLAYRDFSDVFAYYNSKFGVADSTCNEYLIDLPLPYDQSWLPTAVELWSKPDSCTCARVSTLYGLYQSNISAYGSFSQFMSETQGTNVSESVLDSLLNLCSGNSSCNYLSTPLLLPPSLQCGAGDVCVNCLQFSHAYDSFEERFPDILPSMEEADSVQRLHNRIFANFMNQHFGFSKTAQDYLSFRENCYGYKDTLVKKVADFKDYYYATNPDQVYGGYKISKAAVAFVEGSNAAIQARQYLDGSHLPAAYQIAPYTNNFDAKLRSVIRNNATDSGYHVVVPHPLQNSISRYPESYIYELANNVVVPADFVTGSASSEDLRDKYWAVMEKDNGNYFRCVWSSKNYGAFSYYGVSSPMLKYLPDTVNGSRENHVYNFTYFGGSSSITSPASYEAYFADSVLVSGSFSDAAVKTNTITAIKDLRFAPDVLPLTNMSKFENSSKGLIVTLELKDGTEVDAFIYNNYDGGSQLQWKEAIDSNLYNSDCREAFRYFFNSTEGTDFTSAQIDSVYTANGINPSYCGQVSCDSLVVQPSGLSKPSSIACEDLVATYKDFMVDFPFPEKGAVVKVAGQSSSQMMMQSASVEPQPLQVSESATSASDTAQMASSTYDLQTNSLQMETLSSGEIMVDSFLAGRDLFEWYFNGHLNVEGYSYENYMDWLVNECHFKLHQLPLDSTANVCCDTLQILLDSFLVRYPDSLGSIITETKIVPVHKVLHAHTQYNSSGGFLFENVKKSAASLSANTWTNSNGWFIVRDNLSFNFNVLPRNATINTASLNLYAKPDPIEYYPCCGAHYRRTTDSVYGVFERLTGLVVPGQTLPSTLPATVSENALAIAPISVSNGQGGTSDIFSNENYLNQSCTELARDLYGSAAANHNYGLLFRLSYENLSYKAYNFWGITSNTPAGKLPALEVNYTANRCDVLTAYLNDALGTHFTPGQVNELYRRCGIYLDMCDDAITGGPMLCGRAEPLNEAVNLKPHTPCEDSTEFAVDAATQLYEIYLDSVIGNFNETYTRACMAVSGLESFSISRPVSEYHYTLYYYDQAGNLVKTVPPEGVHPNRNESWLAQVKTKRANGETQVPAHVLSTRYRYNSLNQVVSQKSPDGGLTTFWYDRLGRLVVSQNAQQQSENKFSYTKYDAIGRITEVGQKLQSQTMSQAVSRDAKALNSWLTFMNYDGNHQPKMVTLTDYDVPSDYQSVYDEFTPFRQKAYTLRNRVSRVRLFDTYAYNMTVSGTDTTYTPIGNQFTSAIEYSYDIHGNVDSMLNLMGPVYWAITYNYGGNAFKLLTYKYDLISGKVNEVHYQPSNTVRTYADEFYHRYEYDAENRLTDVYTADNKAFLNQSGLEEHEAHYDYYKHGPLARVVLGQQKVQGIDYAYTLQGWLKGVNSTAMKPDYDMGGDSKAGNEDVARDAYGFNLNYFAGDYASINGNVPFPGHYSAMGTAYKQLYNGNIASMALNIKSLSQPQLYNYSYDQLNRLVKMDVYKGFNETSNSWSALTGVGDYAERVAYDANGNILSYVRHGYGANLPMDSLTYHYWDKNNSNQIEYISDGVASSGYGTDLTNQGRYNYHYDKIGNLTTDGYNGISQIKWNVYGKITNIYTNTSDPEGVNGLGYLYDPNGNRVQKDVYYYNSTKQKSTHDWYVRDAQGNVMAVYSVVSPVQGGATPLYLSERYLYGSSRLGVLRSSQDMNFAKVNPVYASLIGPTYLYTQQRGNKFFELSNHLGNVLVTISDRKVGVAAAGNGSLIDHYEADVVNASDYYPFGMLMPGRRYSAGSGYRYGFNGKENDNEVKGEGNQLDYGARIYDPRVGRFLSTDPLKHKYPSWTPYAYAMNDVIRCIDLDGEEKKVVIHWIDGFYDDGAPKIRSTSVDINKNITYINVSKATGLPLNDGKRYAGTEVYYAMPDGRFIQQQTMYEEITAGGMTPSANYDYTQNVIPGKQADDSRYTNQYNDASMPFSTIAWWIKATSDIVKRDMAAPDNAQTMEDLGGVNAALTVIGAPMQIRGMQALRVAESNKGWSAFSRNYQKQVAGTEGEAILLNGTKFDGLVNGALVDAKGKYAFLLEKGWAQEGLLKQAQRQIKAANGAPIEWHFAEEAAANTVQQLFKDKGVTGISVHYTPSIAH